MLLNGQRWSTAQLARLSKVSSRTLRHYHEIGLLNPATVASNGLRYYGREQLLRLQQILVLRDLGLGLDAIAAVVNGDDDLAAQLRRHHRWLMEEHDRLARLAATVAATLAEMEGGDTMRPEQLFENFDAERQARYEEELVERLGEAVVPHIQESKRRMAGWTTADAARIQRDWATFGPALIELIDRGAPADDPRVLDVIGQHYQWVCNFWTPNREAYTGLGQLYVDHPGFRANYDAQDPRLAEFMRDAMAAYALARL